MGPLYLASLNCLNYEDYSLPGSIWKINEIFKSQVRLSDDSITLGINFAKKKNLCSVISSREGISASPSIINLACGCANQKMPSIHGTSRAKARLLNQPVDIKNSTTLGFLSLPFEVRRLIYIYIFGGRTILIEVDDIHDVDEHFYLTQGGAAWPEKSNVAYEFSAFLSPKNRSCWGPMHHHVCTAGSAEHAKKDLRHSRCSRRTLDLRMLRTCKQVYAEAWLIPYHTNTFAFSSPPAMARFCGRSLEGTKHPWNQTCQALQMHKKWSSKRLFFRKGSAKPKTKCTPISEIRHLRIEAGYNLTSDHHDWNTICKYTAYLWSGLQHFRLRLYLAPATSWPGTRSIEFIKSNSGANCGFRAYRNSPLQTVLIEVCDEYWNVYHVTNHSDHQRNKTRTAEQIEEFANGIRDWLLGSSPSQSDI